MGEVETAQDESWKNLPVGHWFFQDSPNCTNRYSVMERTSSGSIAVCSTSWHYDLAKRHMQLIAELYNRYLAEPAPAQPMPNRWPTDVSDPSPTQRPGSYPPGGPETPAQPKAQPCGECVISVIAGVSWIPCVLPKGHDGGHRGKGNCFKHGEYIGMEGAFPQCSKWPDCISQSKAEEPMTAEQLAQTFHETYERLAPEFGYETRKASAKPWSEIPTRNQQLMVAVCREVLSVLSLKLAEQQRTEILLPDMGPIRTMEAKWLDPECHDGCQSLVFKAKLVDKEKEIERLKADLGETHPATAQPKAEPMGYRQWLTSKLGDHPAYITVTGEQDRAEAYAAHMLSLDTHRWQEVATAANIARVMAERERDSLREERDELYELITGALRNGDWERVREARWLIFSGR